MYMYTVTSTTWEQRNDDSLQVNKRKSVHKIVMFALSPSFRGGGKMVMFLPHWIEFMQS